MNVLTITKDVNALREHSAAIPVLEQLATATRHLVVIVLNTKQNQYPSRKISDALWVIPTNALFMLWSPFRALRAVRRELYFQGKLQADVIAAQDAGIVGFTAFLIATVYRRPFQMHLEKNVLTAAYGAVSFGNFIRMWFARYLAYRADSLHVASENIHAALADMSTSLADRAIVARPYMNIEAIQQEPIRVDLTQKYPQFKVIILAVAPFTRSSNLDRAIDILAGVVRVFPYAGLVIVGEGPLERALKKRARKIDVAERVVFEGFNANLSSYYKTARIFLSTSTFQDYEDSLIYAAAASCAIVSARLKTAESFIVDGESGYLCDEYDTAAFVDRIVTMIHKPELCNKIRLNANVAIQSLLSSDMETHVRLYKESWEKAIAAATPTPIMKLGA